MLEKRPNWFNGGLITVYAYARLAEVNQELTYQPLMRYNAMRSYICQSCTSLINNVPASIIVHIIGNVSLGP